MGLGEEPGLYRWKDVFGPASVQPTSKGLYSRHFDLDQPKTDLQNIDFQLGMPVVYRHEIFPPASACCTAVRTWG